MKKLRRRGCRKLFKLDFVWLIMAGINYKKVAEGYEEKGKFKEAADYFSHTDELDKAHKNYKKALSKLSPDNKNDKKIIKDIERRFKKLRVSQKFFKRKNKGGLEKKFVFATLSMISLVSALFFSVSSLTGYSVSGLTNESFRFGGVILFALGLVFAFFYFKVKK